MKSKDIGVSFVILFCLSSILFFNPYSINIVKAYYAYYLLFFFAIIYIVSNRDKYDNQLFTLPILLLLLSGFMSTFSATLFWDQSMFDSIKTIIFFLGYSLFYLVAVIRLNARDIEKIVIIIGILYILLYFISFFSFPKPMFGNIWWGDNRGFQRIVLPGVGFLFFFSFYSLNRYFYHRQFGWLIIFSITFLSIIMTLTRQWIAISFVFLALFAIRKSKYLNKIIIILFISSIFFVITQMNFYKILINRTISETSNIEDNIRTKSADFYLFHFSPNLFTKVFGNGAPYMDSNYGYYMKQLEAVEGLYTSDIGYIGLYSKFGLLAIIAYLLIIIRTLKVSIKEEFMYCKYFLYFIFVIGIMSNCTIDTSFFIPVVLALYILSSQDLSRVNTYETLK